jgi:hypothetical protein
MEDWVIYSIAAVLSLVAVAGVYSVVTGPSGPLARGWKQRLAELEVATRMGPPEQIIDGLRESAKLYRKLGKRWEAETVLRRALLITRQNFGEINPTIIPVLNDFASLMDSMHRNKEAQQYRKDAARVQQQLEKTQ